MLWFYGLEKIISRSTIDEWCDSSAETPGVSRGPATRERPRTCASLPFGVSERAVGTDQNKKFVLVVAEGNKAEYREVVLGPSVEGLRVVQSGLKAGERIVVNGLQRVRPGAVVEPQAVAMASRS